jgi:hypothetical protein
MAAYAWNEINPLIEDEQTKPHNPVPTQNGDDEIPVTVEAPMSADELPTDPTGGGV